MRHRWEQSEKQMVDTDNEAKTLKAKHQITEKHRRERKEKKEYRNTRMDIKTGTETTT